MSIFSVTLESELLSQIVMSFALTKFARTGATLVEITVVVAVIVLLVATAIPGFLRASKRSQVGEILNHLHLVDSAVDQRAT
jgi:type II secretory pathway pseudopilin PulG